MTAGIAARKLVDPFPYLNENGFSRASRKLSKGSLVRSDLYLLDHATEQQFETTGHKSLPEGIC